MTINMNWRRTGVVLGAFAMLVVGGCDDGSGSGGTTTGGGGAGTGTATASGDTGNAIDRLADDPKSLYGRSAGYARDVAEQASQSGADATGIANELGGGGGKVTVTGLTWSAPSTWAPEAPEPMREAQFSVPGGASVYWSHFPGGQGGTVQANIDRWAGQVLDRDGNPSEPSVEEMTVGGFPVTIIHLEGTYMDGPPMGQKVERRRWAMLGAIIEGPQGLVFIKMTGPKLAISEASNTFKTMLEGMK